MNLSIHKLLHCIPVAGLLVLSGCCPCPPEQLLSEETSVPPSLLEIGHHKPAPVKTEPKPVHHLLQIGSDVHYGIDISHYQGNALEEIEPRDSLRFVICKATQGDHYVDPDFRGNWREIEERGFIRGAYHFYMCEHDPIAQANHFADKLADIEDSDITPILDIEQGSMSDKVSSAKMEKDILLFLNQVQKKLRRKPMIYTDYAFAQEFLKNPDFAQYELWLAEYESREEPKVPSVWSDKKGFKIWQRTDSYSLDHRKTDLDVYFGQLRNLVK